MPALSADELLNPSMNAIHYPGCIIHRDSLLAGNWIYPMRARQGLRLGDYDVSIDGGPLSNLSAANLGDVLRSAGTAPIEDRYPVVAVGSNASAGQLAHKYGDDWPSMLVPMTRVHISNIGIGYSAHINKAGYMPYAPVRGTINGRTLTALWLDSSQLERMDETEPNYERSVFSGETYSALLSSFEPLANFILYRGRWGIYRETPTGLPREVETQEGIFAHLASADWFVRLVPEIRVAFKAAMDAMARDPRRRETFRSLLVEHGLAAEDGLTTIPCAPSTYGNGAGTKAWDVPGA